MNYDHQTLETFFSESNIDIEIKPSTKRLVFYTAMTFYPVTLTVRQPTTAIPDYGIEVIEEYFKQEYDMPLDGIDIRVHWRSIEFYFSDQQSANEFAVKLKLRLQ